MATMALAIATKQPRLFTLERDADASGVSGTGRVADGARFPNGWCVIVWCTPNAVPTLGFYADIEDVRAIHGHQGKTRLQWGDLCTAFVRNDEGDLWGECGGERGHSGGHFDERTGMSWSDESV